MPRAKRKQEERCAIWDTFLRIPSGATSDEVPPVDPSWLDMKGVYHSAPALLRLLQREVIPLVRRTMTGYDQPVSNYFFVVHDRESGVPTTADDKSGYIQMRLYFWATTTLSKVQKLLGDKWVMTKPIHDEGMKIAGIDEKFIRDGKVDAVRDILKAQSHLALQIVDTYTDDVDLLILIQQVRQNLHYLSNMFQMRVS